MERALWSVGAWKAGNGIYKVAVLEEEGGLGLWILSKGGWMAEGFCWVMDCSLEIGLMRRIHVGCPGLAALKYRSALQLFTNCVRRCVYTSFSIILNKIRFLRLGLN